MYKSFDKGFTISATEAAWIKKGDRLVIRGKASFQLGTTRDAWYVWHGSHGGVKGGRHRSDGSIVLTFQNPSFTVERSKTDSTLKDKIKARALELKAIEAKEEEAARSTERDAEKADPFKDKAHK